MRRKVIRLGDTTTTAGKVLTACRTARDRYIPIACKGDKVFCPACKRVGVIAEGHEHWHIHNRPVALHNHIVQCGCPYGANRLIASQAASSADA